MGKLLDRAEDPRETLEYSYERQREMLQNVKRGIVEVVTSRSASSSRPSGSTRTSLDSTSKLDRPLPQTARTSRGSPSSASS